MNIEYSFLCQLADRYGSDKSATAKRHNYTLKYDHWFSNKRNEIQNVVEIGIGSKECMGENYLIGASLYMWRDYFPNATIHGLDIQSDILFTDDRIKTYWADQGSPDSLIKIISPISPDIIVDDGSHFIDHQLISFLSIFPLLKTGAFYIIEDVFPTHIKYFRNPELLVNDNSTAYFHSQKIQGLEGSIKRCEVVDYTQDFHKGYINDLDDVIIMFEKL